MRYVTATTEQEAFSSLRQGEISVVAGGTDFFPRLGDHKVMPPVLDITRLPGYRGISRNDGCWRIGAATRWSDISNADLPPAFDGLRAAAREIGSVQIQNRGTIGGNLCNASPAADSVPPLLTLDAEVELVSETATRQMPLQSFITGPGKTCLKEGEILKSVIIPELPEGAISSFQKLGSREYLVISIAMVALLHIPENGQAKAETRVSVGACSPVACRLKRLEVELFGVQRAEIPRQINSGHSDALSPIGDVRASMFYRLHAAETLVRRMLTGISKESTSG